MDIGKIKVGSTYGYTSRKHSGRGQCMAVKTKHSDGTKLATGPYVTLFDKTRGVTVSVRASQVTR